MKPLPTFPLRRQAGIGLITAIFLIVILAGLGIAMVTIWSSQQSSSQMDEQGTRAYQAARAGIEYGLYQYKRNGVCAASTSVALNGSSSSSLADFTVTVACTASVTGTLTRVEIVATSCNKPSGGNCPNSGSTSADYVQRVIEVQL